MHRRHALQATGLTAVGLAVVGQVRASDPPYPKQPSHVTIDGYDAIPSQIEQYQPRLVTRTLDIQPDALYAWRASSPEYEYDWYCYWAWYSAGQEGATREDSHVPDREPVYVAVDDAGDVARVVYDRIHYFTGTLVNPPLDEDHPLLHVINPWHNYERTQEEGQLIDLRDMTDRYQAWINVGWRVDRRSVVDPPFVEPRGHWWPANSLGFSMEATLTRASLAARELGLDIGIIGRQT